MKFIFTPMNEKYANDVAANWHYDDVYSFYDMAADEDDLRIFMDTENWQNITRAVLNENDELVGWASFYTEDDGFCLSLGLRPDLTGKGLGEEFVSACVRHAVSQYKLTGHAIRLHVALFNQRAIKVYQRVGFIETNKIIKDTHIGQLDFIEMEKHIPH
jgi:ribosomal-protein-alanine N-acetyltransferase